MSTEECRRHGEAPPTPAAWQHLVARPRQSARSDVVTQAGRLERLMHYPIATGEGPWIVWTE
jgi:hypothetical protein